MGCQVTISFIAYFMLTQKTNIKYFFPNVALNKRVDTLYNLYILSLCVETFIKFSNEVVVWNS